METAAVSGAVRGRETVRGWETVRAYDVDRVMRIITAEAGCDLRQCRGVTQALYNACERLEWQLTPEEALVHPKRHIITRAIGAEPTVEAELFDLPLEGGALLLCSDGLSGVVPPDTIASAVRENPASAPGKLIRMALDMGSTDNVTALVVYEDGKEAANG